MGASAYWYYVLYQQDFNKALQGLKEQEFKAGRFYPNILFPEFPVNSSQIFPHQYNSFQDAQEAAEETGTRSILDITEVSEEDDYCIKAS